MFNINSDRLSFEITPIQYSTAKTRSPKTGPHAVTPVLWDEIDPEYERVDVEDVGTFWLAKPVELPRGYEMEDSKSWRKCVAAIRDEAIVALNSKDYEKTLRLDKRFEFLKKRFQGRNPMSLIGDTCDELENYRDYLDWVSLQNLNQYLSQVTIEEELTSRIEESVAAGSIYAIDKSGQKHLVSSEFSMPLSEVVKLEVEVITHYYRIPEEYMGC